MKTKIGHLIPLLFFLYACQSQSIKLNIICDGNSLTAGQGASISYPKLLERKLNEIVECTVTNIGVGAQTTIDMLNDEGQQLNQHYAKSSKNILFVWEIRNHLVKKCPTNNEAKNEFKLYCTNAKKIGFKVYVLTLLPSYAPYYCSDSTRTGYEKLEDDRLEINEWLRNDYVSFADGLVDIAMDSIIGQTGQNQSSDYIFSNKDRPLKTTYYADGTHLTQEGYDIVAEYCKKRILKDFKNEND